MRDKLYKRGEIWWCRVRDARGRIVRRSTKCADYQAAELAAREFERDAVDPAHAAAKAARLDEAIVEYFADLKRREVSVATLSKETTKAGHLVRVWPADLPMAHINARRVTDYIDKREGEGVSPHTVKMELQTLARVLLVARHHGTFHEEIDRVMPLKYGSKHKPKKRAPSLEELRAVFDQLEPRRAAHLAFFAATTARLGEAKRAQRCDVDSARGIVRLRGTKTALSEREIPITIINEPLLAMCLTHAPGGAAGPLFHPWGKLHRDVAAACVRAGVEGLTPNDLRRACATWHRAAGVPVELVAVLLGHATDKLAQTTYARLGGEQLRSLIAARLEGVSPVYQGTLSDGTKVVRLDDVNATDEGETSINMGAPGSSRNSDQRFRNAEDSSAVSRRSLGTKLGLARASLDVIVPSVNVEDPWKNRGRAFLEAVGNLGLALAGVAG